MLNFLMKLFGSKNEKDLKKLYPRVDEINQWFNSYATLSDTELKAKTQEFKLRLKEATEPLETRLAELQLKLKEDLPADERYELIDEVRDVEKNIHLVIEEQLEILLPEAFAVVKETSRRLVGKEYTVLENKVRWDMVPYDVQLIGGMGIHHGKIAEMATGEGKTLVSTLPIYLNSLSGKGVHVVTVNDYLAQRDSQWMYPIFEFHGITVGCILNNMPTNRRKEQYNCDITYGTNNEFGFDYLRDNMAVQDSEIVHRNFNFAIIDEVDSVLIDEARTPLIISGPVPQADQKFDEYKPQVELLYRSQSRLVDDLISKAKKHIEAGETYDAGLALLRAHRGMPKNDRLISLLSEPGNKKIMQTVEHEFLRENSKRMPEVDEELYFSIEEKNHSINLTDKGREFLAKSSKNADLFLLPDLGTELSQIDNNQGLSPADKLTQREDVQRSYAERSDRIHTVSQLLKAYTLYEIDVEYVVQESKVMIVDQFTGRILPGRRYSDGLHQAIEAKEGVKVERDTQTFATITIQNYFRLYNKLAGMTGTAETEATEFFDIYKLDVIVIPTNRAIVRDDREDRIYRTRREKFEAIIEDIKECREKGRPVLVGTTSVETSELISRMLKSVGVPHNVLNAKQHQREAEIVSLAGQKGAVTVATNMAGRGTDIKLGEGVKDAGGLHIIGTERHESRRIDRQLRGRAGRQGDPGSSQFYVSLEDNLMRLFVSDRVASIMDRMGLEEGEVIQHPMVTKSIERAQKKVEENNFMIRKRLLEYDDVMNQQREIIYTRRRDALTDQRLKADILDMAFNYCNKLTTEFAGDARLDELSEALMRQMLLQVKFTPEELASIGEDGLIDKIEEHAIRFYEDKEKMLTIQIMKMLEKAVVLQVIDEKWRDHLRELDDLKEGIGLRAYGQKDPLLEYKQEAFRMFSQLIDLIGEQTVQLVFKAFPTEDTQQMILANQGRRINTAQLTAKHDSVESITATPVGQSQQKQHAPRPQQPIVKKEPEVGRNEPCPCGSGKKYKQCHGR